LPAQGKDGLSEVISKLFSNILRFETFIHFKGGVHARPHWALKVMLNQLKFLGHKEGNA
jgi:hypothetical protein